MKELLFFLLLTCFNQLKSQTMDTLTIKKNDTLQLEFEDQIGMGYYWQLNDTLHSKFLKLVQNIQIPREKDEDGGTQKREFVFKAHKKGTVVLQFNLKRGNSPTQIPKEKRFFKILID